MYKYRVVHLRILCGAVDPIGPVQDLLQGAALIADFQVLEDLGQSFAAQRANLRGRLHTAGDGECRLVVEDVPEETGISRQKNIKKRNDLIAQYCVLPYQTPPVTRQQAEWPVNLIEWKLDEAEAVGGRAMDGEEIGVVGLVSRIGGQAVLLGCQWMDDPRVKLL